MQTKRTSDHKKDFPTWKHLRGDLLTSSHTNRVVVGGNSNLQHFLIFDINIFIVLPQASNNYANGEIFNGRECTTV